MAQQQKLGGKLTENRGRPKGMRLRTYERIWEGSIHVEMVRETTSLR